MLSGTGGGVTRSAWASCGCEIVKVRIRAAVHTMSKVQGVICFCSALQFFKPFSFWALGRLWTWALSSLAWQRKIRATMRSPCQDGIAVFYLHSKAITRTPSFFSDPHG